MSPFPESFLAKPVLILVFVAVPLLAEVISIAAQQAGFPRHDLAFYLDPSLVDLVRPGLKLKITAVAIQKNQFVVRFKVTDPKGLPLDRDGVFTPGAVSTSFVAAYIPKGEKVYTSYVTRLVVSPISNQSAVQGTADSGGVPEHAAGDLRCLRHAQHRGVRLARPVRLRLGDAVRP